MPRPLLVDLFCCQGGASTGYEAAGFRVIGVDMHPQPRYPFPFVQMDAILFLFTMLMFGEVAGINAADVVAYAASPPCQRRTRAQKIRGREHPRLITPTRQFLRQLGRPYIIENVVPDGPDDDPLIDPVTLCGAMFGLHTYRHRQFEASFPIEVPSHPGHDRPTVKMGRPLADGDWYHAVGNFSNVPYVAADLGVPWMTRDGMRECIPPSYARHVGAQLAGHLGAVHA